MADPRVFTLIGDFQDNITPSLEKINTTINSFKRNVASLSTRRGGYSDITKSVGSLISSQKHLANSVKEVKEAVSDAIPHLRDYRREVGKAAAANFAFARSTGQAARNETNLWRQATKSAEQYKRMASGASRSGGGSGARPRSPQAFRSSPSDYYGAPARQGRGMDFDGGYRGSVARDATFAFGQTLGYQLSNIIVGSITQGFQIGVGLMAKPFEYFAGAIQERIGDELSDIQAAGGLLAVARRQKDPFVKSFQESMRFTQQTNARFAEIAAALPGNTQQYIEVGKRLGDTAARIVSSDTAKAIQEANVLRSERGVEKITGSSRLQQQAAIQELLTSMTTQTVLAGMGGGAGAGRTMGPYGLPQLTERMIGEDQVTMSQFQRYAAIFRDPAMAQALERYIPEINKTQRNTVERFKVLREMYQEVLPPEVIRAYERSLEGIKETYHTAFMNPETGLFGIGRKLKGIAKNMNQFGQYIKTLEDGSEQVLTEAEIAAGKFEMVDMSVFDLFRDILANVGVVLGPIVNNLTLLFDPMKDIGNSLVKAREVTGKFLYSFEAYRKNIIEFAQGLKTPEEKTEFAKIDVNFRASLAALNNLYRQVGIISEAEFLTNAKELKALTFDAPKMLQGFINKFMDSDIAENIGATVGTVVATVFTQVAKMVQMFAGLAEPNRLMKGFMDSFKTAGGTKAIQDIIKGVFKIISNVLIEIFKLAPAEFTILGGVTLLMPAFMAGVSVAIGTFIEGMIDKTLSKVSLSLKKGAKVPGVVDEALEKLAPLPTGRDPITGKTIPALDPRTQPTPKATPTKAGRLKNFLKGAVGADDSVLGRPLINLVKNIRASLSGLVGKLATLKPIFSSFGMFIDVLVDALGMLIEKIPGIKQLGNFINDWMDFGFKPAAGNAAKGFKNFFAKGKGGLASLFGKGKGLLGGLLGGAKGGGLGALLGKVGGGIKGLFGKGMKGLGKFGGIATIGVGIVEALMALFSGDSLGQALGKGAGPVIGTIIGTALLGPLGGIIGGMIGSMEAVTGPLGDAATAIMGTLGTTFEFLGQIGRDLLGLINGLVGMIPGVSEGFNALEFALFALLSPFKLLEIAISGLYDLYLWIKSKTVGVNEEERERMESRHTQMLTDQFTILARMRSGHTLEDQKKAEYAKWLEAKERGDVAAMNRTAEYMKSIEVMLKERGPKDKEGDKDKPPAPTTPTTATTPSTTSIPKIGYLTKDGVKGWQGTDGTWTPLEQKTPPTSRTDKNLSPMVQAVADVFSGINAHVEGRILGNTEDLRTAPKQIEQNAKNTTDLNKKATDQLKKTTETTLAIKDLTTKITAQTSVQTTVAAIYNLLASGSLRVNGVMAGMPGVGGGNKDFSNTIPGINPNTGIWEGFTWYDGGLGDAISKEMRHAPAGSRLVLANSSETVIPAGGLKVASGYGMGGGGTVVNGGINVTVNGSGVNDPDELASLVAMKISEAVSDARGASIFT